MFSIISGSKSVIINVTITPSAKPKQYSIIFFDWPIPIARIAPTSMNSPNTNVINNPNISNDIIIPLFLYPIIDFSKPNDNIIIIILAINIPIIAAINAFFLSISRTDAIKHPVHAPVPGNGIPTNNKRRNGVKS